MSVAAVLLPVFVQIALTFALLFWTGRSRFAAVRAGTVRPNEVALGQHAWPEKPTQIANCYNNQFQLPVLFYLLVAFAMITNSAGLLFVLLSWVFVLSRLWHAYIHTTSNNLLWRFRAFLVGLVVLIVMWVAFALRILILS